MNIEIWLVVLAFFVVGCWVWLTILSIFCLILDPDLDLVQRSGQCIVVILFPILGAIFVLSLINDHSPEVIARFYIPWPFKSMVLNKDQSKGGPGHNNGDLPDLRSGNNYGGGGDSSGGEGD